MFHNDITTIDLQKDNTVIKKQVNLDKDLDCFIVVSSSDAVLAENILNHALENIIEKVDAQDTYNDFGIALENINSYLKTWRKESSDSASLDMVIAILNDNNFMFSNIGKTSAYLLNDSPELIELTERNENKKEFLFISNGHLSHKEVVVFSTINLMNFLSKSDLLDSMILANDAKLFNKNIENILQTEILEKNYALGVVSYFQDDFSETEEGTFDKLKEWGGDMFMKVADLRLSKKLASYLIIAKNKLSLQGKNTKNAVFVGGMLIGILILYTVLSFSLGKITKQETIEKSQKTLIEVREYIGKASQAVDTPIIFQSNIKRADELVKELEEQNMFEQEVREEKQNIANLKKRFNKVELFVTDEKNLLYKTTGKYKKIVTIGSQAYAAGDTSIVGPISSGVTPKVYANNNLTEGEKFVDMVVIRNDIILLTNKSRIVRFSQNKTFSFSDVVGQDAWEKAKDIESYGNNLYILGEDNQIYKHLPSGKNFKKGIPYLKDADVEKNSPLISIAIDGGIYLLKDNLAMLKFFSSDYRLEGLLLSKIPRNESFENMGGTIEMRAAKGLKYVYLLLNNQIWIFRRDSSINATKSLTYVGQVEGASQKIIDLYSESDGKIWVLLEDGIYTLKYQINDNKLTIN